MNVVNKKRKQKDGGIKGTNGMSDHEAWYEPLDQITTFLLLPLPAPHPPTFSSATRPTIILLQSQSVSAIYLK